MLVDPGRSEADKLLQVLNGSHALLPYSANFWAEHLLDYATVIKITPDSPLGGMLASLHSLHMHTALKLNRAVNVDTSSQPAVDARLAALSHLPISPLCASIIAFQEACKATSAGTGEGKHLLLAPSVTRLSPRMIVADLSQVHESFIHTLLYTSR